MYKSNTLSKQQIKFIDEYVIHQNATLAAERAGFVTNTGDSSKDTRNAWYGASDLLRNPLVQEEISRRLGELKNSPGIATSAEILQFYTSVMRGEVLDQFGIEASLDVRIRSANELAKHLIELPMKMEQKREKDPINGVVLNFLPRKLSNTREISQKTDEIDDISS